MVLPFMTIPVVRPEPVVIKHTGHLLPCVFFYCHERNFGPAHGFSVPLDILIMIVLIYKKE